MDKSMLKYIARRLLISAVTLFVILVVLFALTKLLPCLPSTTRNLRMHNVLLLKQNMV